uniref:HTH-like domain-containing protein n=1 Tax=Candidatus Kentrum sp. SD TaxID=2126332 RepID=A0A450Z889_9GAMM|nr:MAG: HTH-like domain-containing protein [Candidatus Kentron sp. SD]
MTRWLNNQGHNLNRKRIRRLMGKMGLWGTGSTESGNRIKLGSSHSALRMDPVLVCLFPAQLYKWIRF